MNIAETVRSQLCYDCNTGSLTWIAAGKGKRRGQVAGSVKKDRYRHVKLDGKMYLAHRLAWLIVTGEWPSAELDHVNGDRDDNSWLNLREASRSENMQNVLAVGATREKRSGKWHARIGKEGRLISLGRFETFPEARAAYLAAKREFHVFQPAPRNEAVPA